MSAFENASDTSAWLVVDPSSWIFEVAVPLKKRATSQKGWNLLSQNQLPSVVFPVNVFVRTVGWCNLYLEALEN